MDFLVFFGDGVRRVIRTLVPVGMLLCLPVIGADRANAAEITDYTLIVVGESSTGGNDSIWDIPRSTRVPSSWTRSRTRRTG